MKNAIYFPISHDATLGERITALRKSKGIKSVQRLAEEIFEKIDKYKKTGVPDTDNATIEGIRKRIVSHLKPNSNPKMEFIKEYCDFFHCESDFLLGYIDFPTKELQAMHEITGLNEKSVETVIFIKKTKYIDILNYIMEDCDSFYDFLSNLDLYINNEYTTPLYHDKKTKKYIDCSYPTPNGNGICFGKPIIDNAGNQGWEIKGVSTSILESHAMLQIINIISEKWKENNPIKRKD